MRKADNWIDYELIDCSDGERLERWGDIILVRPDPQVIWKTPKENPLWYNPHAIYNRSNTGGGSWRVCKKMPDVWQIGLDELRFNIKTMGFKHTGLFPEQAVNWKMTADIIKKAGRPVKVLNLFAYTGGATVAALNAGASVTHVDASKGMTLWAKENAAAVAAASGSLLLAEGLAVGALVHGGVRLMGTHQDPVQRAVVLILAVVSALLDGAFDALVCMTVHGFFLLLLISALVYLRR